MDEKGAAQLTFGDYVIGCLQRIHQVSCDANKSFAGYAHRSAIEQMWHSIPSERKKGFLEHWDDVQLRFAAIHGLSEDKQESENNRLVGELMQILTDCLNKNRLLFKAENAHARAWRDAAKLERE